MTRSIQVESTSCNYVSHSETWQTCFFLYVLRLSTQRVSRYWLKSWMTCWTLRCAFLAKQTVVCLGLVLQCSDEFVSIDQRLPPAVSHPATSSDDSIIRSLNYPFLLNLEMEVEAGEKEAASCRCSVRNGELITLARHVNNLAEERNKSHYQE